MRVYGSIVRCVWAEGEQQRIPYCEMFRQPVKYVMASICSPLAFSFCAEWPFDSKGFPTNSPLNAAGMMSPYPMLLSGVGMRRKNLYILEVDVYLAAAHLSPAALNASQTCMKTKCSDMMDAILSSGERKTSEPKATITCRFVRDVGIRNVVDAFKESFAGLPQESIDDFASQLRSAVGDGGMKKNDEVIFVWMGNGIVNITKNGEVGGVIRSDISAKRLLEVYLKAERTVSPQLLASFEENVEKVSV